MNCNEEIHDALKDMDELICPFCDQQQEEYKSVDKDKPCCDNKELLNDKGMIVCKNCGEVDCYNLVSGYVDFYQNMYGIRRKSVYHRKYHIENILNRINEKHGIKINYENRQRIHKIFELIDKVIPVVNGDRKRMIGINFLIRKILQRMKLPCVNIKVTSSKKTLKYYNLWRNEADRLIKHDLNKGINM